MLALLGDGNVKVLRPVQALVGVQPPGIAHGGGVLERRRGALRELARLERQMAAHADDEVRRLDLRGARAGAGAAGRAGEELLVRDDLAHEGLPVPFTRADAIAQLHDDRAGLQGRAGAHGRTDVVAPAALDAGVKRDAVRPGELRDRGDAEGLLLLDVVDLGEDSVGGGLAHGDARGRAVEVRVEGEGNRGDEAERGEAVDRPEDDVRELERRGLAPEGEERAGDQGARGRKIDPGGLLHRKAQTFDQKAREDDEGERDVSDHKPAVARQVRIREPAPPGGEAQGEKRRDPRRVEHKLVDEVDGALEELFAEDVVADVPVKRRRCGAEKKQKETEDEERVHPSRARLPDPRLPGDLGEESPHARRILGKMLVGASPPALHVEPDAPGAAGDGEDGEQIDADLAPERDVPEGGTDGEIRGQKGGRHM